MRNRRCGGVVWCGVGGTQIPVVQYMTAAAATTHTLPPSSLTGGAVHKHGGGVALQGTVHDGSHCPVVQLCILPVYILTKKQVAPYSNIEIRIRQFKTEIIS